MKEQIITALRESEKGLRVRELAAHLHTNHWGLLNELDQLLKAGLIRGVSVENFVQGEFYTLWQAV